MLISQTKRDLQLASGNYLQAIDTRISSTDSKIADMLGEQGILVARRTIAKYREALQIPPVNMRKAL